MIPIPIVTRGLLLSAILPTNGAIRAPIPAANPNKPIVCGPNSKGSAANNNTMVVQNIPNEAKANALMAVASLKILCSLARCNNDCINWP
ncbi:hypothetical protein D3C78_1491810 [compost metagenome]